MSAPSPWAMERALRLIRGTAQDINITGYHVAICSPCLDGKGGECHTPGCLFWMCSAPDIPIRDRAEDSNGYHVALALDAARAEGRAEGNAACIRQLRAMAVEAKRLDPTALVSASAALDCAADAMQTAHAPAMVKP